MVTEHQLVAIFCEIDDFCKDMEKNAPQTLLTSPSKGTRGPAGGLSVSEITTIQIMFQMVGYRNFKIFYTGFLQVYWKKFFPNLPGYTRFVELIPRAIYPLTLFSYLKCGKKREYIILMGVVYLFVILKEQNAIRFLKKLRNFDIHR